MSGSNENLTIEAQVCALVLATALITCQRVWDITDKYGEVKDIALMVNSSNISRSTLVDYVVDETVLEISLSHFLPWLKREEKWMRMQLNVRYKCADASVGSYYGIASTGCSVSIKVLTLYSTFIPGSSTVDKIHYLKEEILMYRSTPKGTRDYIERHTISNLMYERPLIIDGEVQTGTPRKAFHDLSSFWYQKAQVKEWMAHAFNYSSIDFASLEAKKAVLTMALGELGGQQLTTVDGSRKRHRASDGDDESDEDESVRLAMEKIKKAGKISSEEQKCALRLYDAYIVSGRSESEARQKSNKFLRNNFFGPARYRPDALARWILQRKRHQEKIALLWMDGFSVHKQADVAAALEEAEVAVALLPANMTDELQVLDLVVNKPLKTLMRREREREIYNYFKDFKSSLLKETKNWSCQRLLAERMNPPKPQLPERILLLIEYMRSLSQDDAHEGFRQSVKNCFTKTGCYLKEDCVSFTRFSSEAFADRGSLPESRPVPSFIDVTIDAALDRLDSSDDEDDYSEDDEGDEDDEETSGGLMHDLLEGAKSLFWRK